MLQNIPVVMSKKVERFYKYKQKSRGVIAENLTIINTDHPVQNSSTSFLTVYFWNARSIGNKTTCLFDFLSTENCDLMAIAETWLNSPQEEGDSNQIVINKILPANFKTTILQTTT